MGDSSRCNKGTKSAFADSGRKYSVSEGTLRTLVAAVLTARFGNLVVLQTLSVRFATLLRPLRFDGRTATGQRERIRGHVLVNRASSGDERAVAHGDRRNQRRVRADEGVLADHGPVLADAVVVAGDGSRADVGPFAHL